MNSDSLIKIEIKDDINILKSKSPVRDSVNTKSVMAGCNFSRKSSNCCWAVLFSISNANSRFSSKNEATGGKNMPFLLIKDIENQTP